MIKNFDTDVIKCPHRFECHGCQSWDLNYLQQLEHKKNDLKKKLNNADLMIQVKTAGSGYLRTRFDFTIENQKMGLYGKDPEQNKKLIDLSTCSQLDPDLNNAFKNLKTVIWPFEKGSVRLRISPEKKLGIWLDLANIDIKKMLLEKMFLMKLSKTFFVEIGQKRKALDLNSFNLPQLKLTDPIPQPWFQTQNTVLYSYVSSFTQPSWHTADLISENVIQWISELNIQHKIIEYGSGIGQFSLPLLKNNHRLHIFETDLLAIDCLRINTEKYKNQVQINDHIEDIPIDLILVNPPRSGLTNFVKTIMLHRPENIIYVSCYPDSMMTDLNILLNDYKITKVSLIDQFPQTLHYESMVLLQRIN
jgi:23S rRNA (uracil1939-C5)-methyltransferase